MNNKEIAKRLARVVWQSNSQDTFAIQLFVEQVIEAPDSYTQKIIEDKILEYLNGF